MHEQAPQPVNRRPDASTEALATAYEHTRFTECEVYGIAKELQGTPDRSGAAAVDRLGQHLSGDRGELEDELAERDPTYFQK